MSHERPTRTKALRLIRGTFSAEDARHVLLSLITDKISFHELKSFSDKERLGRTDARTVRRIAELKAIRGTLLRFLEGAAADGAQFHIDGRVLIRRIPAKRPRRSRRS